AYFVDTRRERTHPGIGVCIVVAPYFAKTQTLKGTRGELHSIGRVCINDAARRVIARRVVVAVFDEVNVVAQGTQAEDVLQVMPRQPTDWTTHNVAENDNTQAFRHRTPETT